MRVLVTAASRHNARPRAVRYMWLASLAAFGYSRLRGPILTWGATQAEADSRLPGDELLEPADGGATRAIDIDAPAADVWPWLAQMGPAPRGGAYTYDWIENLLGLNMHSTDHVLPQFQRPEIGDTIGFGPNRMRLERVEPERVLAWRSEDGNWVWTFVLDEHDGTTRLISRNRFRLPTVAARLGMLAIEPASLVMERKMLYGIKRRAEQLASVRQPATAPGMRGHPGVPGAAVTDSTAIRTRRLSKDYGQGRGLFDLDLEVERGEVLGFLGLNGAGKSTTMRLLLDLIRPTSGSATLLGLDSHSQSLEIRRRIGFLLSRSC